MQCFVLLPCHFHFAQTGLQHLWACGPSTTQWLHCHLVLSTPHPHPCYCPQIFHNQLLGLSQRDCLLLVSSWEIPHAGSLSFSSSSLLKSITASSFSCIVLMDCWPSRLNRVLADAYCLGFSPPQFCCPSYCWTISQNQLWEDNSPMPESSSCSSEVRRLFKTKSQMQDWLCTPKLGQHILWVHTRWRLCQHLGCRDNWEWNPQHALKNSRKDFCFWDVGKDYLHGFTCWDLVNLYNQRSTIIQFEESGETLLSLQRLDFLTTL